MEHEVEAGKVPNFDLDEYLLAHRKANKGQINVGAFTHLAFSKNQPKGDPSVIPGYKENYPKLLIIDNRRVIVEDAEEEEKVKEAAAQHETAKNTPPAQTQQTQQNPNRPPVPPQVPGSRPINQR